MVFSFGWGILSGSAVQPLHPFNLVLATLVAVGSLTIWLSPRSAKIVSGVCGVLVAGMMIFQFWGLLTMFTSDAEVHFRARFGPFELEGMRAHLAIWIPPLLLAVFSVWLLCSQIQQHSMPIDGVRNETESA
ncbi:MAG: hypothetical protein QM813_22715 [Verrucomicrobiota bacterium]